MAFPCELEEEIISRLPPRSLVRLKSVCKHWNTVIHNKSFLNNHLSHSRPQFMVLTESNKIYSIEINDLIIGTINKCEIPCEFPCQPPLNITHTNIVACDGLLFRYFWGQGLAVWNPWVQQVGWIKLEGKNFRLCGIGYDTNRRYKILLYFYYFHAVYDCDTLTFKSIDAPFTQWSSMDPVSLNGNLYWVTHDQATQYFIRSFDFSTEIFQPFCSLPWQKTYYACSELLLSLYERDRFSLLKQCYNTRKIEIWVTKTKIIGREKQELVWINLLTLPTTNLPKSVNMRVSYFIFDKTLIMCCRDDKTGAPCIYIVREDLFKEIPIDSGTNLFNECVYLPNFISVPSEFLV